MKIRAVTFSAVMAALLACHHGKEGRIERIEPADYRGPPVPSTSLAPGSTRGALVGAVYDCRGDPVTVVQLTGRRITADSGSSVDTLGHVVDSMFTLNPLNAGDWELYFKAIGYKTRLIPVTISPGRLDTLMVQLSDSPLKPIGDCVCANRRDFGSHCCKPKPVTIHVCSLREPE